MKWYCSLAGQVVIECDTREEAAEYFFEGVCRNEYGVPIALTQEEVDALY